MKDYPLHHTQLGSFWHDIFHPVETTEWLYYKWRDSKKIERAFVSVFGRRPTDKEVANIIEAYIRNKSEYGDVLKRRGFVLELQKSLNRVLPNKIAEDGIFYWQTVAGIMKFQELRGLKPTGILNKATWREIITLDVGSDAIRRFYETRFKKISVKKLLIAGMIAILLIGFLMRR
jgi:hypothetical protein